MTMKLYFSAVALAVASVALIVSACMLHESSRRAVPITILLFN
jgi:hypothetical protein